MDLWCPSHRRDGCNVINIGSGDDTLDGLQIYVDELYTANFLDLQCHANSSCDDVEVICDGDKALNLETMTYDDASSAFYCQNGGASYCCPIGNCTVFNDPEMGFDSDLIDIVIGDEVQLVANSTAHSLESTVDCVDAICIVQCLELLACGFTTISINSSVAVIECDDHYSCLGATVIFNEDMLDHNVSILCLGMFGFVHSMSDCDRMAMTLYFQGATAAME